MAADELVIGYIAGAHGIRGGLRVRLFSPDSDALAPGRRVQLRKRDGTPVRAVEVVESKVHPGTDQVRLRVRGVDDRSAAEALKGCELVMDRAELPELEADEYYLADVIGHRVWCRDHAVQRLELGIVVGLSTNGVQDLLEVEFGGPRGKRRWLLPALPGFVVDLGAGELEADLPEGFLPESLERRRVGGAESP